MSESKLKPYAPIAAVVGLLGLLAAAVIWLLMRDVTVAVQASLAVGLLGLALALLFNPAAVQQWLLGRQARYGGNVAVMVAALLGILILANYLVIKNPQRWDWTEDQANNLSPETVALINALEQPVKVLGFYSAGNSSREDARTLLETYRVKSGDQITFEFHDIYADLALVNQYSVVRDGGLIVVQGDAHQAADFATEEQITGAISRLLNPISRVMYYLTGTGERDFVATDELGYSTVGSLLKNQSYDLRPLNLQISDTVPSDARVLVVAGSQAPVTAEVVAAIKTFVDGGGQLLVLSDAAVQYQLPLTGPEPLADYLLADWGIALGKDVVLATASSNQGQMIIPLANNYGNHAITAQLENITSAYFYARSVSIPGGASANPAITLTPLVLAGEDAWGETNVADTSTEPSPEDVQPPIYFAVAAENSATGGRLVVFGDSDFASNGLVTQGSHAKLFVASANWVAKDENIINIAPRIPTVRSMVPLSLPAGGAIFLITVVGMPLAVLVIGGVVWFRRRRHV